MKAEFTREELQEIGIALMGRFNTLGGCKENDPDFEEIKNERKQIQELLPRITALLDE